MDEDARLRIFHAQTENVRELTKAWKQVIRAINCSLRKSDYFAANIFTKTLVLVFRSWSEANFSKLIHTPHGFDLGEIDQIKTEYSRNGLGSGWEKCLELGLQKSESRGRSNYLPNVKQKVSRIIDDYVTAPSEIRNKISHGQWLIALNRQNGELNETITKKIEQLDVVNLSLWYESHKVLANIIEILIESPNRAFHREYWKQIAFLDEDLKKKEKWTLESKIEQLKRKT